MSIIEEVMTEKMIDKTRRMEYAPGLPWYMRGRLTLTTGAPVTYGSVNGSMVYFTPYLGGFDELSIVLNPVMNGTTSNGLPQITDIADTAQLTAGMTITGAGVPAASTVLSVDSTTQITISANATASAAVALTFGVPANTCIDFWQEEYVLRMTLWGTSGYGTSARGYALTSDRGIWYMPGGITQRYLGTGRTLAASVIQDGYVYRFLWNLYNQIPRYAVVYPNYSNNNATTTYASIVGNYKEIVANAGTVYWVNGLEQVVTTEAKAFAVATAAGNIGISYFYDAIASAVALSNMFLGSASNPAAAASYTVLNGSASSEYPHAAGAHCAILGEYTVTNVQTIYADAGRGGGLGSDISTTWLMSLLEN